MNNRPIICTYYFPNWHVDARNEEIHGKGWTEWRVVQHATPRFPGHEQPRVPLWGYTDEADPTVMEQKIQAATDNGIDAFVFDWYYYVDGAFRERCLQEGFLPAANCHDIKFALMWANHDHGYAHPGNYYRPVESMWSGDISPETFYKCTEYLIQSYFSQPNYLRVNDALYFSIHNLKNLVKSLGGIYATGLFFKDLRHRVEKANLGKIHLDGMLYSAGDRDNIPEINDFVEKVGLDSLSNYSNLRGEGFPSFEYDEMTRLVGPEMERISQDLCIPYNPVITTGFDNSPRTVQSDMFERRGYPFNEVAINNGPQNWEACLNVAKKFIDSGKFTGDILHLSCWNEWTEGAYLEPDTQYGYAKLEAVKKVFGKSLVSD